MPPSSPQSRNPRSVRAVAADREPIRLMGGLAVLPDFRRWLTRLERASLDALLLHYRRRWRFRFEATTTPFPGGSVRA